MNEMIKDFKNHARLIGGVHKLAMGPTQSVWAYHRAANARLSLLQATPYRKIFPGHKKTLSSASPVPSIYSNLLPPVSPHSNTQHKHDCGAESPVSPHSNTQHKHDCGAESPLMVDQNPLSHPTQTLNTSMTVALNSL
ncbi:hypothetical protein RRG08_014380 [Elysia crispata]|uniref:Uncharacterized protein n=1 Tax=Elysia crispata TaxID=231223 RepID=A0AAE0YN61_9GAST|nr:hypothetical protein RRG08_014380 [Elysia crispata]